MRADKDTVRAHLVLARMPIVSTSGRRYIAPG